MAESTNSPVGDQSQLEVELRQALSQLDEDTAAAIAAADEAIGQAEAALPGAGTEYDEQVADSEAAYQTAQAGYGQFLTQTSQDLASAQSAIDAIDTDAPTIGTVQDIDIATGGTPDCSAAAIEAAVNAALAEIRQMRADILAALTNGNVAEQKNALQSLKDIGEGFRDQMPPASDLEAEKQGHYDTVDGLYP
jgi:hypothetical protein